jgi:hypothetical protein
VVIPLKWGMIPELISTKNTSTQYKRSIAELAQRGAHSKQVIIENGGKDGFQVRQS